MDVSTDIIIRARSGDLAAFELIYKKSARYVYSLALRIIQNREDAEEVTQDVFLKIYKNLNGFRFRSSFKTWVYRITCNTAINRYKKRIKESQAGLGYDDIEFKTGNKPFSKLEDSEEAEMLARRLLNLLPLEQRTCVILRNIEGLSYKEISETLGVNINTVRTRLKRAREKLLGYYRNRGD